MLQQLFIGIEQACNASPIRSPEQTHDWGVASLPTLFPALRSVLRSPMVNSYPLLFLPGLQANCHADSVR